MFHPLMFIIQLAMSLLTLSSFCDSDCNSDVVDADTVPMSYSEVRATANQLIQEVEILGAVKDGSTLRTQPASGNRVTGMQLQAAGATSLKDVSQLVPNFFMPDYGSKLTSAIYIRGIGSRIGTPAVGVYVDNVPYYDKTAFDFNFLGVEGVDVLRGPQSTLYGRNTMGGLVRIYTTSPMGAFPLGHTDARLDVASYGNVNVAFNHLNNIMTGAGPVMFSLGGFYKRSDGYFVNAFTGKGVDAMKSGGGRLRAIYIPMTDLRLDANVSYEYSDEGAYPYYHVGQQQADGSWAKVDDGIVSNLTGRYRRGVLNASLNAKYTYDGLTFSSVTAWQNINDRMFMDQDFIAADIYSLTQKQRINTLSEELLVKNSSDRRLQWLFGATAAYQWLNTKAPVEFRQEGVTWLNNIINTNANANMPPVTIPPMTMNFMFDDHINGDGLLFDNDFDTPMLTAALYHQSTVQNLFDVRGMDFTLGLRLDYEKMWMHYNSWYDFTHTYALNGQLTGPMTKNIQMIPATAYDVANELQGKLSHDYLQFLPRFSLSYRLPKQRGSVYATVSRGYRSGGYNIQNMSELMRSQMTADMMTNVRDATLPVMANYVKDEAAKAKITNVLNGMADGGAGDVSEACLFRPEYAWNYEVGSHLNLFGNHLNIDASLFVSEVRDLQLSQMTANGLGRITVNAGKSRSMGGEVSLKANVASGLVIAANYGYTYATLRNYAVCDNHGVTTDCCGNYVPFVPKHTVNTDVAYTFRFVHSDSPLSLNALTLGVSYMGAGRLYWDEMNSASQSFYSQFGVRLVAAFSDFDVQCYAHNLFNAKYNTFWFTSMDRAYEQHCKPMVLGMSINLHLDHK